MYCVIVTPVSSLKRTGQDVLLGEIEKLLAEEQPEE